MRAKFFKILLLFWTIFIGIGAFVGGIAMLIKPDGSILHMQTMLPYFQVLPFAEYVFQDYVFPGIALIIVNGISNVTAFVLILKKKKIGYVLGTIFGFTLMLWITIQFIIFPPNWLDNAYFTFGCLQLVCGYAALVSYNQENFKFDEKEYRNISKNSKTLVVFFSRLKYTKKIAYINADSEKAEIEELKTNERTQGTLGFWWCGRFAMHGWKMETLPLTVDLNKFDKVILVTPIWVFRMCSPMRDFIAKNQNILKTKEVEVIFNHFNPWLPKGAVKEITDLVPVKEVVSKTTMLGHTFM